MDFVSDVLSLESDGSVATLWLDHAARRNAMGPAFWNDLPRAMEAVAGDDAIRAVVIGAKGEGFTAGLDLKSMDGLFAEAEAGASQVKRRHALYLEIRRLQASISSVADCRKPVIAAVHGFCIGGGIDLITACDIRLASMDAIFSVRETRMALVADVGTLQRLPAVISPGHVAELVYTGKDVSAERALAMGLVNDVYPDADAVYQAARSLAGEIAANSPLAVQGSKAVLRAGEDQTVAEGLDYIALWNSSFLQSHDLVEAVTAFREKRTPQFRGE